MATIIYKGTVIPAPYFQFTQSGKALLKFKIRLLEDRDKKLNIVVWGDQAEKNAEIEPGEEVMVSGTWKQNDFKGTVTDELHLGDYGGNLKRTGVKGKAVFSHGESAPQRRKQGVEDAMGQEPDISDPPDFSDVPFPTDKEFKDHANYTWTQYALTVGEIDDPDTDRQYELFAL